MNTQGYIKVHRTIWQNPLWSEPFDKARAWIDLIMLANYNGDQATVGGKLIDVPRGCLVSSFTTLAKRWKWSLTKTRDFMGFLEEKTQIKLLKNGKKIVVEIVNYELYQGVENGKKTEKKLFSDDSGNLHSIYVLRNKEIKEIYAHFEEFWLMYPKKTGKSEAKKAFIKILSKEQNIFPSIKEGLLRYTNHALPADPQFIPYPATWLNQRRWEDELVTQDRLVNCINPKNINEVILPNGSIYAKIHCMFENGKWRRR